MEIKKVESVVMTGVDLAEIISLFIRDSYDKDMQFGSIFLNGEEYLLTNNTQIRFEE
jgi:hypothetical protein